MDDEGERPDDLSVNLQWPERSEPEPARGPDHRLGPEPAASPPPREWPPQEAEAAAPRAPFESVSYPLAPAVPSAPVEDVQAAMTAMGQRLDSLTDAIETLRTLINERLADLDEATTRLQAQASRDLQHTTTRLRTELTESLDEHRRQQEARAVDAAESLSAIEEAIRRVDQGIAGLAVELATVGQQLGDDLVQGTETTRVVLETNADRLSGEIDGLAESVATALGQVATQLERVAATNGDDRDVVEALAQALDDVAARMDELGEAASARHERLLSAVGAPDLQPVRTTLGRIEGLVEALAEASDEPNDAQSRMSAAIDRLERTAVSLSDRMSRSTAAAMQSLNEATERATTQIKAAAPARSERAATAALARLEERVAELSRQREEHERQTVSKLDGLEETVGRLADAQSEDLERILDSMESVSQSAATAASPPEGADADRLARLEAAVTELLERPVSPAPSDAAVAEQLSKLGGQLEALRRRIAVRARPGPALDPATMRQLADVVVERLARD